MANDSVFHAGEQRVHERLGLTVEDRGRRMIRSFLPDQHRAFYADLEFIHLGLRDRQGRPWATLAGRGRASITAPDRHRLVVPRLAGEDDPAGPGLTHGQPVAVLGLDFSNRRRNRAHGVIDRTTEDHFEIAIHQAYGNCPKYISIHPGRPTAVRPTGSARQGRELDSTQQTLIAHSQSLFVATGHADHLQSPATATTGMDVSHRGGPPGFVRVHSATRLSFPDYPGNQHFSSLGNLMTDERLGLSFFDFDTGRLLQLSGRARINWQSAPGAERSLEIDIDAVVDRPGGAGWRWPVAALASV